MSEDKKEKNDGGSGGLGIGAAVLVAAGAGAIGFMAGEFWGAYQACKAYKRAPPTTEWENRPSKTPDKNMGTRKKNRESCKDQNLPDEMKCIICVDNPREICLVPCGHVCLCEDCADKISNTCPMCKTRTVDKKPIYM